MIRTLFNLFIILIISITAIGMPAQGPILDLPFNFHSSNNNLSYELNGYPSDLVNPTTIEFTVRGENLPSTSNNLNHTFLLDIIKDNHNISTIKANSFIKTTSTISDAFSHYSLDLSQKDLDLPDGNYTFALYSTAPQLKDTEALKLNVTYYTLSKYSPATSQIDRGMMGLTLYFPDKGNQYLIPVTRFVKYNNTPLRTIIENLRQGAHPSLGFLSPIPEVPRLQLKGDLLTVHLPNDLATYNTNPTTASFALRSFVDSLTSVQGINRIKFLVGGKESDDLFNGVGTQKIFPKDSNPKVFLGLNHDQRLLLVPTTMDPLNEKELIEKMMDTLKTGILDGEKLQDLTPPIPDNVSLMDSSISQGTLTLDFTKELLYAHGDRIDLQRFMIDAILCSFSTIDGIENIKILVDHQVLNAFGGLDLSQVLEQPKYINLEEE